MLRDEDLHEYAELGRQNAEIIELVNRHCSHAVVEKSSLMGQGMLEPMLGLPLDGRTVRCPHALNGGMAGMRLEGIAFDFWQANCTGCTHRRPVGLPNLTTWAEARIADEQARAEREERMKALRDEARTSRSTSRRAAVAGETSPVRELISLIDGIDAEQPDERAQRFIDQITAAPELVTQTAAETITAASCEAPHEALVAGLAVLNSEGMVEDAALSRFREMNETSPVSDIRVQNMACRSVVKQPRHMANLAVCTCRSSEKS